MQHRLALYIKSLHLRFEILIFVKDKLLKFVHIQNVRKVERKKKTDNSSIIFPLSKSSMSSESNDPTEIYVSIALVVKSKLKSLHKYFFV